MKKFEQYNDLHHGNTVKRDGRKNAPKHGRCGEGKERHFEGKRGKTGGEILPMKGSNQ